MSRAGQIAELARSQWAVVESLAVKDRTKLHALAGLTALALARPCDPWDLVGIPLIVASLLLRTWALGCVSKNRVLCTWGPYRYTRNPLYVANLIGAMGLCVG